MDGRRFNWPLWRPSPHEGLYFEVPPPGACWAPLVELRCQLPKGHDGQHFAETPKDQDGRYYQTWWR